MARKTLSVMRRVIQNMLKLEKFRKLSTNKKRTLAAFNPEYRLKLLEVSMTM
jgi:hypothetical protein